MDTSISGNGAEVLSGLSLSEAFVRHVLQDALVVSASKQLLAEHPAFAPIFYEGWVPGPSISFHWPIECSAEDMAADFRRPLIRFLDDPPHRASPSESTAARAITAALQGFRALLASGAISAVGTFVGSGSEVVIGAGQWKRRDLTIDVQNSAICDGKCEAIWTGVYLRAAANDEELGKTSSANDRFQKTRKQISTKEISRRECTEFMVSLMSDPEVEPMTKESLWELVRAKWPDKIGRLQFNECRKASLEKVGEEQRTIWTRPGPRQRRP